MSLIVVGSSVERTMPVAAVASLMSGEKVSFTSREDLGELIVRVEGTGLSGTAVLASVDPGADFSADGFVIAAAAEEHEALLGLRPSTYAGKPVLLAPGGFAGALVNERRFAAVGADAPSFSEVPGWIGGGHLDGGTFHLTMRKRSLEIAAPTDDATAFAAAYFGRYLPGLTASDLLTTSLSNINAIIHPPLALLNATRMENAEPWHYWDEGFTPSVHRLMTAVDGERVRVIEALGGKAATLLEMALTAYAQDGLAGASYFEAVKGLPLYRNRRGPSTLESRFLTDDVPNGIAAYEQLAAALGLDHEALTAVRVMSEIILGRRLTADPAAVAALTDYAGRRKASEPLQAHAKKPEAATWG